MITAVLDTNVLASGLLGLSSDRSTPGELLRRWTYGDFVLTISSYIGVELRRTLQRPYFAQRLSDERSDSGLRMLEEQARFVDITVDVGGVATHPEDDLILATALSAQADYLVSGDLQLQRLTRYGGVHILGPRDFLEILRLA